MLRSLLVTLVLTTSTIAISQQLVQLGLNQLTYEVSDGYTLFAPLLNTDVYLINNCGEMVHQWDTGTKLGGNSVELLEDGTLLKTSRDTPLPGTAITGGGGGQYIELIDWNGTILWQYEYFDSATVRAHHDVEILPNGNILALAWDVHTYQDCIDQGRDPNFLPDSVIWGEHIIEINPTTNQIVWEWWLWDHLVQDYDPNKNNYDVVGDHPELMDINFHGLMDGANAGLDDWIHANSIAYNANLDQIVMNSRHTGEFYIIDHSTTTQEAAGHTGGNSGMGGDILYRWGNPEAYDQGNVLDIQLFGAHDVHWIPDSLEGPNKLLLFNNGWQRTDGSAWSNVLKLELPWNVQTNRYEYTPGTSYEPQAHYWEYEDSVTQLEHGTNFFSGYISGAQALYNGNTLVCDGAYGRLVEINSNKDIVWEYYNPIVQGSILNQGDSLQPFALGTNNPVFRALKYHKDFAGFAGKSFNGTAAPIEGNYATPYECAGFAGISENSEYFFNTYPNPVNDILTVHAEVPLATEAIVYNNFGQPVLSFYISQSETQIDVSNLENGLYFLHIGDREAIKVNVLH